MQQHEAFTPAPPGLAGPKQTWCVWTSLQHDAAVNNTTAPTAAAMDSNLHLQVAADAGCCAGPAGLAVTSATSAVIPDCCEIYSPPPNFLPAAQKQQPCPGLSNALCGSGHNIDWKHTATTRRRLHALTFAQTSSRVLTPKASIPGGSCLSGVTVASNKPVLVAHVVCRHLNTCATSAPAGVMDLCQTSSTCLQINNTANATLARVYLACTVQLDLPNMITCSWS